MLKWNQHNYLTRFPHIPDSMLAKNDISELFIRPFGLFETDLNVNFSQKLLPYLLTQLLQCCTLDQNGEIIDQSFFLDLTVGKRIESLLTIALNETPDLSFPRRCLNKTCQQQMELDISIGELLKLQQRADDSFTIRVGDESLSIRKPTGRDQLEWLTVPFRDESEAIRAMIQTLVLDTEVASFGGGIISDEWIQTIDNAMEEFDPLVNFNLLARCPYCEEENRYSVDLEEILLTRLHKVQMHLLDDVHRLAEHYHWSEAQILAIPPWRRSRYLALIEGDES